MKGYRTIWLAGLVSILPALEVAATLLDLPQMRGVMPAEWWPFYALFIAALKALMRKLTTTKHGAAK